MQFSTLSKMLVILLIPLTSFGGKEWKCAHGKIQYRDYKEIKTISSNYCYNTNKTSLISKSCLVSNCIDSKLKGITITEKLHSTVGNPSFKFCRAIGGSPQIMKFYADSRWWKLNRCIFEEDSTYIDTSLLFGEYYKRQRKAKQKDKLPR